MMIGQPSNALQARHPTVKCVVWDLDNTLWDGVLLEDEQVTLRQGIVEIIQTLDSRGILHSIASKNDHAIALEKLQNFGLSDYFLYPQMNWNSKASSIRHIAQLMNLSLDTFAFVDDQAFERDEVNFALPNVLCIDAKDILTLPALPEMMPRLLTRDSQNRRKMYLSDITRKQVESEFIGSNEEFLATLEMVFTIAPCTEDDLQRAEELTVRTHQLNTTGYTYSYDELNTLRLSQRHKLWVASLDDKYGSYGKIGLALVECHADVWVIKLLLMSCRVMSRGVGALMLNYIMQAAKAAGIRLQAEFVSNNRNRMMLVTYKFSGFKETGQDNERIVFENDLSIIQPFPAYVKVHIEEAPILGSTRSLALHPLGEKRGIGVVASTGARETLATTFFSEWRLPGNTPIQTIELVIGGIARKIYLKLEGENPTGSMKDRTGYALIQDLLDRDLLKDDSIVLESTSGNLGVALAFFCKMNRRKFMAVVDPKTTQENILKMKALDAQIEMVDLPDSSGGYLLSRLSRVQELCRMSSTYIWTNQYENPANPRIHYTQTGPEIYRQMDGRVDAVLIPVSTGGTLAGIGRFFRETSPSTHIVGIDVYGSVVFDCPPMARKLTGIGSSRKSRFITKDLYDMNLLVKDEDAFLFCRAIKGKTGISVGGSSGAVLAACTRYFLLHPDRIRVVCVCADSGENYESSIFNDKWIQQHAPILAKGMMEANQVAISESISY